MSRRSQDKYTSMVLLMGNTGAGKSYFANRLKEGATLESSGLNSCTQDCQMVQTRVGMTNVTVVDCPGFNDTHKSDAETLRVIAEVLSAQYIARKNIRLRGILYFWDITKPRMQGSDVKALEIFSKLVGEQAFPHVQFVTTMWARLTPADRALAYQREKELRDEFWGEMLARGSHATRFDGDKASAEGLLAQMIMKREVSLRIQHELVEKDLTLEATGAGAALLPVVTEKIGRFRGVIRSLQELLEREGNSTNRADLQYKLSGAQAKEQQAQREREQLQRQVGVDVKAKIKAGRGWQDNLRTICTVLQIGVTVAMQVAVPLATGAAACTVM